ncbi:MAG: AAA family ATPase, partial [Bacilli bacterium]|nr:AAA family ATPase [Bacilli bacterium]
MDQEQAFLDQVISDINQKISNVKTERDKLEKEIEAFGIAEKEDAGTIRKLKTRYRSCNGQVFALEQKKEGTHFGKMQLVLKETDLTENLTVYVGEKSYSDVNNQIIIFDWRSPVCNLYYMSNQDTFTYNQSSYNLLLKRQIEIKNQKITNIYDLFVKGKNIDITDSFLLQVLEDKKSRNEFADIIKTIQANQNNIIRDDLYSNMIVQGVAGSGKTVVLLHRISYLLYNHPHLSNANIIFITPSKVFASKLFQINRSLELNQIKMLTIEEYYLEKIKTYLPKIKIKEIIPDDNDETELLSFVYSDDMITLISHIINDEVINNSSLDKISDNYYHYLFEENKNIRKKTWDTLDEKNKLDNDYHKNSILLNKDIIKTLMTIINDKLTQMFKLKKKNWLSNNKIKHYQAYIILQLYNIFGFNYQISYRYMFIDEMQDYANNEFKLLYELEKKPYFNLYGDINQNIRDHIPGKELNSFINYLKNALGISNINKYELLENYRNSQEVITYCNRFLPFKIISMGINSDNVFEQIVNLNEIFDKITNLYSTNEIVVLANDKTLLQNLKNNNYECYSIIEAKGLE